ncbi:hypothetical protein UT4_17450 [Ferrigenium sp. UT4]
MSNQLLTGLVMGKLLGGGDKTAEIAAEGRATRAAMDADMARSSAANSHNTALAIVGVLNKERKENGNWRRYANRLRANLNARKMSEATLLEALKQENINHPLATTPGFEAHFKAELEKQYGNIDAVEDQAIDEFNRSTAKEGAAGRAEIE